MRPQRLPIACVFAVCLTTAVLASLQHEPISEVRALWVTRNALTSPAAVARMVSAAERGGFNTLVTQVRGRGDAYYHSSFEPRASTLAAQTGFDPLAETLRHAHRAGLKVHAWVAVNLVSSAVDLPISRQHVIYRQPDWLMVPRALAAQLRNLDPRSPEYLGRLARWTRARPDEVEGLYMSPIHAWAARHITEVITELVTNYDVDGVHLDYVRFPNEDFDYSRAALQQFKLAIRPQLADPDRRRADSQERVDPFAYPDLFPERWLAFRQSRLTTLLARIRLAIKAARPDAVISAAVVPDVTHAATSRSQDWRSWLELSLIDVVCPMAYTQDVAIFERHINEARSLAGKQAVWAGIGAYQLTTAATLQHIEA
ncbi:MAG: glycoside hydrolase family 10 protein, partial [Vicinamibacterales bacterium]